MKNFGFCVFLVALTAATNSFGATAPYSLSKIYGEEKVKVQDASGKMVDFTVYLVATTFDSKGNPMEFVWRRPGGAPFMPEEARPIEALKDADRFAKVAVKIRILNEVLKRKQIGLPDDVLKSFLTSLHNNDSLEDFEVRSGTRWDFSTAGDYKLGNPVLSYGSNFTLFLNTRAKFPGKKVTGKIWHGNWAGEYDGHEGTYEADLVWAESCGNLLGNIRFVSDASRVEKGDKPGIPADGPNIILPDPEPIVSGSPRGGPLPPFDVREEGWELGTEFWAHASSETVADGHGGYKMDGMFVSQIAATVVGEYVKKFGNDEDDPYIRLTGHLGMVNAGTPSTVSDEEGGGGTGTIEHISVDGVFTVGGDYKLTTEVDVYATQNSNASSLAIAPTVSFQPTEGRGPVASVTYVSGSTDVDATSITVDSNNIVATAGYRFGKDSRYAPFTLDSGPYLDLRARYTTQEYESDVTRSGFTGFRSEFKGFGAQVSFLTPLKIWTGPKDGMSKQKGLFLYGLVSWDKLDYSSYVNSITYGWIGSDEGTSLDQVNAGLNLRFIWGQGN
ncbi:MAG: hypothetical protein Q8P33_00065 [bacterium]|nr:hypothetical protein [bacterium]